MLFKSIVKGAKTKAKCAKLLNEYVLLESKILLKTALNRKDLNIAKILYVNEKLTTDELEYIKAQLNSDDKIECIGDKLMGKLSNVENNQGVLGKKFLPVFFFICPIGINFDSG
jgi:tRNA G18 (ribose-2'-O)-methylase SpoU